MSTSNSVNKIRNQGIDLLRIVSMFMVVTIHIVDCGGVMSSSVLLSANYNVSWFIHIMAYCAVNCYALISGYVGLNSKRRVSSFVSLWLQVAFYSIIVTIVFYFMCPELIGTKEIIKAIMPVSFFQYWYFSAYFAMWFFIPIMNAAVQHMSKIKMGVTLLSIMVVIVPISIVTDVFLLNEGFGVIWLCYLYLVGAYLAKFDILKNVSVIKSLVMYFICIIITFLSKVLLVAYRNSEGEFLVKYISPTIVLSAISLLAIFVNINIPKFLSNVIIFFSPLAFSVYLIHTHPLIYANILKDSFAFLASRPTWFLVLTVVLSAVAIFLACATIDYLRFMLFKALRIGKILSTLENRLVTKVKNINTVKRFAKEK